MANISNNSIFNALDSQARVNLENYANDIGMPSEKVLDSIASLFQAFTLLNLGTSPQNESLSEKVQQGKEKTGKVPSVATFSKESIHFESKTTFSKKEMQYESFSLTDFNTLPKDKALDSINMICHTQKFVSKEQVIGIYNFFSSSTEMFDSFLNLGNSSVQFDAFLNAIKTDSQAAEKDRNFNNQSYKDLRQKVYDFAFSAERFESIQIQNEDISKELNAELLQFEAVLKEKKIGDKIKNLNGNKYAEWLDLNMEGSSSVSNIKEKEQWIKANEKKSLFAAKGVFDISQVCLIHKILTQGAEDVKHPGAFRRETGRVGTGRGSSIPPPAERLEMLMGMYENWLQNELTKCANGSKSIILTAAQAYQRLVSIHPFENGNGRISRLMMNYVLERFDLPPAILGDKKNVLDALFSLEPRKSKKEQEAFVRKVFEGVKKSANFIG